MSIQPDLFLDKDLAEKQIIERSKQIDYYITEYSVGYLAQKMQEGEYYVPNYQREFTWEL